MTDENCCGPHGAGHHGPEHRGPGRRHAGPPHGFGMGGMCGCGPKEMKMFGQMAQKWMHAFMGNFQGGVPYNLEDKGDHYLVSIPLAGRTKEDVKVSLINSTLNVKAEKPRTGEEESDKKDTKTEGGIPFTANFFRFVKVDMDIQLPADADKDTIKSLMQNGLLKIKVGKKPPTNIDISDENN
jgi:HSP20 family molecular chaperone IbpA